MHRGLIQGRAVETLNDILTRFQAKIQKLDPERDEGRRKDGPIGGRPHLLPDRHPIGDFFVADILEWALKDDRHSMEHPFFSLSKNPDRRIRHYEHNGLHVTVAPSAYGLATIWDKDVLIYAVSQLVEALNQGRTISRTVHLKAYDLLVATNRHTGGRSYERLKEAFRRLRGTTIETDIPTNGVRINRGFGLIDGWKIIEKSKDGRMVAVELNLSEWLYNAVLAREVLTLDRDYFRLDGGLERRLYELARKHCGNQPHWAVSMELLHKKSGSTDMLKRFRAAVKQLVLADTLPGYRLRYEPGGDQVTFYTKDAKKLAASLIGQLSA
jgi:plasmid replication initiation protein